MRRMPIAAAVVLTAPLLFVGCTGESTGRPVGPNAYQNVDFAAVIGGGMDTLVEAEPGLEGYAIDSVGEPFKDGDTIYVVVKLTHESGSAIRLVQLEGELSDWAVVGLAP